MPVSSTTIQPRRLPAGDQEPDAQHQRGEQGKEQRHLHGIGWSRPAEGVERQHHGRAIGDREGDQHQGPGHLEEHEDAVAGDVEDGEAGHAR